MTTPPTRRILPWNKDSKNVATFSGLQTPQTSHVIKTEPLLTPSLPADGAHRSARPSSSPFETPTPTRFKDVGLDDLAHDVFALLQAEQVSLGVATETSLRALLSKHQKAAEGFRRGRDVTRSSIKRRMQKLPNSITGSAHLKQNSKRKGLWSGIYNGRLRLQMTGALEDKTHALSIAVISVATSSVKLVRLTSYSQKSQDPQPIDQVINVFVRSSAMRY
jgi:hypothetical protein